MFNSPQNVGEVFDINLTELSRTEHTCVWYSSHNTFSTVMHEIRKEKKILIVNTWEERNDKYHYICIKEP